MRLTAKERILLHLLDYVRFQDSIEVPAAMTQEGLASTAWVELRHLSQYLRPLLHEELVRERTCHVQGIRQRRKVYALTPAGQHAAYRLRDRVKAEVLTVRDGQGIREEPVAEVLESAGGKVSLLELVHRAGGAGPVDLERLVTAPPSAFVEQLSEAPGLDHFVGRKAELEALVAEDGPRLFLVRGVAGIGKSSVAARACDLLRGRRNLFWHTLRPWDTRISVLTALGEFLSSVGKPGLRAVVTRGDASQAADVLREDLPGTRSFLVFDDAHEAGEEILPLFRFLKDAIADAPDVRAVLLSRRALPFYDRRDVALRGLVKEIDLGGLPAEDIAAFFSPDLDAEVGNLGIQLGGHPLFLQLVRSTAHAGVPQHALRDMRRFLEEEVYAVLPEPERRSLKLASLYRVPMPEVALLPGSEGSHDVILSLLNRSLLRPVGDGAFEAHDSIRAAFAEMMAPGERTQLGAFAAHQLLALASSSLQAGEFVAAVGYLSNALLLVPEPEARVALYEALGDANEGLGDLPATLTAYKEAMRCGEDPEVRARLHRKSGEALRVRGDVESAEAEVEKGLALLGDRLCAERGWLDLVQCTVSSWHERWDAAYDRGNDALRTFRAFGDRKGEGWALYQLGFLDIEAYVGDPARSEQLLRDALEIAVARNDVELMARVHTGFAYLFANRLGRVEPALRHLEAIEHLPRTVRDPHARRSLLMLKGWLHLELLGDCDTAETYFQQASTLGRKIHDVAAILSARAGLASCVYCRGQLEEARRQFDASVEALLSSPMSVVALEDMWLAAECSLRLGDVEGFRKVARRLDDPRAAASVAARPVHAAVLRGVDCLLRGDRAGWREAFRAAFEVSDRRTSSPDPAHLALVHSVYGITLRAVGEDAEASQHLAQAREIRAAYHLMGRDRIAADAERELTRVLVRSLRAGPG